MKLLFAHDHRFIPVDNEIYSESQFPASLWQRYLREFGSVVVFAREGCFPVGKDKTDLQLSSTPNVSFAFSPSLSSPMAQLLSRKEARLRLLEYLKNVDAVVARLPSELGLLAASEALKRGIPLAVEMAGCPWDGLWNYGSLQGKLYAPFMTARVRRVVSQSPYTFYVTREFLQRRYPNANGYTIACSDVEIPSPSADVLSNRIARISRQARPIILGLIGTLNTRYKGIQTIFEALSLASHALPPIEFHVLAGGDPKPWIAEAKTFGIEDRVFFDGTLPSGGPVLNWLDNLDIYLQPSFKEGLPRALVEAMSRGCPAIASTCAGIPELLPNDCLIKPGDARHLADLLVKVATDTEWQRLQAERNWKEAGEYSRDKLEARRNEFWSHFAAYAKSVKNKREVL